MVESILKFLEYLNNSIYIIIIPIGAGLIIGGIQGYRFYKKNMG